MCQNLSQTQEKRDEQKDKTRSSELTAQWRKQTLDKQTYTSKPTLLSPRIKSIDPQLNILNFPRPRKLTSKKSEELHFKKA